MRIKPSKIRRVPVVTYFTVWLTVPEVLAGLHRRYAVIVSVPAAQRCCPERSGTLLERYHACRSSWSIRYILGNEF